MRAYVYRLDDEGRERLGTDWCRISPAYQRLRTLQRYFVRRLRPGTYRVYVHRDWERRYGPADQVYTTTVFSQQHEGPAA